MEKNTIPISFKDLLNIRIEKRFDYGKKKGKSKEYQFSNKLNKSLKEILNDLGYNVINISKEFRLYNGICDFLCQLNNGEYLIIECKVDYEKKYENCDLRFSYAIGQLLTYRYILSMQYGIEKEKIKLMLATDKDSIITLNTIQSEHLDICYLVFEKGGIKFYANK